MRMLAVASLALLIATPASAQQWTAEQQELIDHIEMCWDAWVEALADETPDHFFERCRQDEHTLVWWTNKSVPQDNDWVYRNWQRVKEVDVDWADMRPVAVNIFGDVGIVYLYGYWIARTAGGPVTTEHMRTEVFQRRNGEWVFLGLQGTPSTPADSEPYQ